MQSFIDLADNVEFPSSFFIDIAFKPSKDDPKNDIQWTHHCNFCQKKLNEKMVISKTTQSIAAPTFEIGSAMNPIVEQAQAKSSDKQAGDLKSTPTKKVEAAKEISTAPEKMEDSKPTPGKESNDGEEEEDVDDYIKKLESS